MTPVRDINAGLINPDQVIRILGESEAKLAIKIAISRRQTTENALF